MKFFTMFPGDWLSGVSTLTAEETGAYINLICHYYAKDGVVADSDQHLARICSLSTRKWKLVKSALIEAGFFRVEEGQIRHDRCDEQMEKDRFFSGKQRDKARKRWDLQKAKALKGNNSADTGAYAGADAYPYPSSVLRTDGSPSEDASPETSPSLSAIIFSEALSYLIAKGGLKENSARALLGKWRGEFGDGAVIDAVRTASRRDDLTDPKAWVAGTLRRQKRPARREGAI